MNATLKRFNYPASIIKEYAYWVVMVRPGQVTFGCAVIAAKSECISLGDLRPEEGAELITVIKDFERTISQLVPVSKYNYLALMMVDPNPHFHAIPRYAEQVSFNGLFFSDSVFPKPPILTVTHELTIEHLESIRRFLKDNWEV
jgi:diadenosine tetraphosphate (Ap4A) HIT family hydrolase